MNTSQKRQDHPLVKVPSRRAEDLLEEWANIQTEYIDQAFSSPEDEASQQNISRIDEGVGRLIKRHPEVFGAFVSEPPPDAQSDIRTEDWMLVAHVQRFLRLAWDAADARHREWYIFKARDHYRHDRVFTPLWEQRMRKNMSDLDSEMSKPLTADEDRARVSPPPLGAFEQIMYYFQRVGGRARHCPNPECPAPYFLAKKKGQKYCSAKCSGPAQREQKRIWWQQNRAKH